MHAYACIFVYVYEFTYTTHIQREAYLKYTSFYFIYLFISVYMH